MRRTLALSILWAFAGNFCSSVKIPVKPDFKATDLMGRWYPSALATDHKDLVTFHLSTVGRFILPRPPDDLYVDFEYIEDKECYIKIANFWHTEKQGQFITESSSPELNGYKIHIMDTDYDEYNIFHMERDGKAALVLDVDGPMVSATIKQKFEKLASSLGFSGEKILEIPHNDFCYRHKIRFH